MKKHRAHRWMLSAVVVLACAVNSTDANGRQTAGGTSSASHDLSGYWELSFDSRKVPAASLLPSITPAMLTERARKDAHAIRWCNTLGVPFIMDSGRPLDIRQGKFAIIIVPENANAPRYLYLDRSTHISEDVFDPTTYGDSIAHWEGDTLVVDTVGFHPDHGMTIIPGGGFRTETSRLAERYRLLENGNVLSVMFTWTDPKVFQSPHTYEFRYYRLPTNYEARTWLPCDPYNETRAKFLEGSVAPSPGAQGR